MLTDALLMSVSPFISHTASQFSVACRQNSFYDAPGGKPATGGVAGDGCVSRTTNVTEIVCDIMR